MIYEEIKGNLFDAEDKFCLAHCIAVDYAMGAGIATEFVKRNPKMRETLRQCEPEVGSVIYYFGEQDEVLNIITKEKSYGKPTREDFNDAIESLKMAMENKGFKYLAIPLIGSGLDKLDWETSREFIKKAFENTDVHIRVYVL